MAARTSIVNLSGDHEEIVERLAKHLGTNILRRKLLNAIYGRGSLPRSKKQLMQIANIRSQDGQQAQNELDQLAKHHLIVRQDNDGSVEDRSRYLYRKDESVRAIRREIIKFADNPKARNKLPTKRRPNVTVLTSVRTIRRQALTKRKHLNVLYLTADPDKNHSLRVDAEMRKVKEAIRASEYRNNVTVEYSPAAGLRTLLDGLNSFRPQIVHFSGHGDAHGIAMDKGRELGRARMNRFRFLYWRKPLPRRIVRLVSSC
jgi:hypothetical protein